jgi:hypothetical protein
MNLSIFVVVVFIMVVFMVIAVIIIIIIVVIIVSYLTDDVPVWRMVIITRCRHIIIIVTTLCLF